MSKKILITDVVYIGAINTAHLDIGLLMLNAGKHVLCKDPINYFERRKFSAVKCVNKQVRSR